MARKDSHDTEILERGDIHFLYRPKVQPEGAEAEGVEAMDNVERFYMVLKPQGSSRFRLTVIGRKRLPDLGEHERNWGFVDRIAKSADEVEEELNRNIYETKTRGERVRPGARPAGEGVYALVRRRRDVHLAYALELPDHPGPVQKALKIAPEGSLVLSIKNPEKGSPRYGGLSDEREVSYPKRLQKEFGGRRFASAEPQLLDYEGVEFLLIGADADVSEDLDIELKPEHETAHTADILKQLRLAKTDHPTEPLFKGSWR